ncbi:HMG-box [Coemansia reversa NRRL 1564]|uniref:HMG-box n=1 Tax=Coemansia reversa (strain ATCC 12441 / NRRL 1564) TaxID=763665 RepID=A0A2G5B3N3_COERN|nr:HMG-box [Coemansia reversa NRRL 1564]|eukprot:PIA13630.1 HMG-box [Coemansia reversa NRRL 1564]
MLRILGTFTKLAFRSSNTRSLKLGLTRGFTVTASSFIPAAVHGKKTAAAPSRKIKKPAAAKPKKKKTVVAKKPKVKKPKKGPTKQEQLEAKLNSRRVILRVPKAAPTAYGLFIQKFGGFAPGSEPSNIAERARLYSSKWKSLSDKEKQSYQEESQKLRSEHEVTMRKWWSTVDLDLVALENKRRRRQSKAGTKPTLLKDPFKPKRPVSAFIRFSTERMSENKDVSNGIEDVSKAVKHAAQIWKNLSDAEKAPFTKAAQADTRRYREDMDKYLKSHSA